MGYLDLQIIKEEIWEELNKVNWYASANANNR